MTLSVQLCRNSATVCRPALCAFIRAALAAFSAASDCLCPTYSWTAATLNAPTAAAAAANAGIVAISMPEHAHRFLRASLLGLRFCDPDDSGLLFGRVLHQDLGLQTIEVAEDRSDSTHSAIALEAEDAVFAHDVAFSDDLVPRLRMTHIVDWDIVMLAPEKRHGGEGHGLAHHVESRGLSLTLGNDPVLDADIFT